MVTRSGSATIGGNTALFPTYFGQSLLSDVQSTELCGVQLTDSGDVITDVLVSVLTHIFAQLTLKTLFTLVRNVASFDLTSYLQRTAAHSTHRWTLQNHDYYS